MLQPLPSLAMETIIPVLDGVILARTREVLAYGKFRGVNLKPSREKLGFVDCDGIPFPMGVGYIVNSGSLSERMSATDNLNPELRKLVLEACAARRNNSMPQSILRPNGFRTTITHTVEEGYNSRPTTISSPAGGYRVWAPRLDD